MIRFISTEDTLALRSPVLRKGLAPELCRFDGDDDENTFHLGYFKDDELICIGSFHKQVKEGFVGCGISVERYGNKGRLSGKRYG
jgi:hypothetical protein